MQPKNCQKILAVVCKFAFCASLGIGFLQASNIAFAQDMQAEINSPAQNSVAVAQMNEASQGGSNVPNNSNANQENANNDKTQNTAAGTQSSATGAQNVATDTQSTKAMTPTSDTNNTSNNHATRNDGDGSDATNNHATSNDGNSNDGDSGNNNNDNNNSGSGSSDQSPSGETPKNTDTDSTPENPETTTPDSTYIGFFTDSNGNKRWYEYGSMAADKAFYDPDTDAWYWADADGSIATNKDVFIPVSNEDQSSGKWVRFDEESRMVKGEDYRYDSWYNFDFTTGEMSKGFKFLEKYPKWVFYDLITGRMLYGEQYVPENNDNDAQWRWYLFDACTGEALRGWQYIGSSEKWVYYEDTGAYMLYGQQYLPSCATDTNYHWYYFHTTTGSALKGWQWISSEHKSVCYDNIFSWMLYGWQYDQATGYTFHFNDATGAVDDIAGNNWSISNYVSWMLQMAADDSHGYDQTYRWGERGDYDCSSFVITALRCAGYDVGSATYTGNMRSNITACGFIWLTDFNQLQVGDILLNESQHTAVYIGNGLLVHASSNEWGGVTGGAPGDQTGTEMCVRAYYNSGWDGYLRRV